jgi:UPF0716 protein FxsA
VARLFLFGLIALPIIEIAIFIKVGQTIGLLPTLALILGAAVLGGLLLRMQGMAVLGQMRNNLNQGRIPGRSIFDAMLIGVAAVLLVLPGFLSDFVALALLIPPVRGLIYAGLAKNMTVHETTSGQRSYSNTPERQIKGTIDLDDDDYRPR